MKKVLEAKQKNYENFKKIQIDIMMPNNMEQKELINDTSIINNVEPTNNIINAPNYLKIKNKNKEANDIANLRKILGFRTHSKKGKNPRKTIKSLSRLSSKKKPKIKKEKSKKKEINEDEFELEKKIIENNNFNKENIFNYKSPNINKIINKFSSSMKETEENSEKNKIILNDNTNNNNISAFHSINREDNSSDKKLVLSHKYTPVKIITEIDDKNENKKTEIKNSKINLSLIFNDFN
jgi:hypothetical protein